LDNINIALISEEFPPFMFGGIASFCYDLARSLSRKRIFTTVFSGKAKKLTIEKFGDYLRVIRLPCLDIPPRFLWFQLQNIKILREELQDFDILHVGNPQVGAICSHLKKKLKKKLVTSIHGFPLYDLKVLIKSSISNWTLGDLGCNLLEYPLNEINIRSCLTKSDHIITCSFNTLNEMKTLYPNLDLNNVSVIYNGVDFDKIDNVVNNPVNGDGENGFSIMYYGRLYWRKGIIHLIRAVANQKSDFHDIDLQIFGRGPLKQKIRRLISRFDLEEKVHLRGHVSYNGLIREIKKAKIIVLPSLYEAQPISVLEAMACGKAVVAFDFPFAREYITHMSNGVLANAEDIEDLSNKIRILLSDKKLRSKLGKNARKYVKRNHNWDVLVEKYVEKYEWLTQ